jgi:hypothetical protein
MFPYIDNQGRVVIGDAWVELAPDNPDYRQLLAALEAPSEGNAA